jgi:hypothetical protein
MKTVKRVIHIEIETERSVSIACRQSRIRWCPICNLELAFVSLAEVAALAGLSEGELIQNHQLHLETQPDNQVFVCLNSLNKIQET